MNKKEICLKELLTKGEFGRVKIGMSPEEVKALLGEPTGIGSNDYFMDFYYGWYEVFLYSFAENPEKYEVIGFQNDALNFTNSFEHEDEYIKINPWRLKFGQTLADVQQILEEEGLEYTLKKIHEITFMIFPNEAKIGFYQDEEDKTSDELKLLLISYHPSL